MEIVNKVAQMVSQFRENFAFLKKSIAQVLVGHDDIIEGTIIAVLAGGHVLLEGLPGLGKTLLVQTLAQVLDISHSRIQFTPDLMPADILGTNVLVKTESGHPEIHFEKGPIFANVVLADEINRATPRTQSALLEAMQERNVTIGGITYPLPMPFVVVATQNPIEMEGTYPLPEAQLDRFFFKLEVPFPNLEELVEIARRTTEKDRPVVIQKLSRDNLQQMKELVPQVTIPNHLLEYAARLILTTHPNAEYTIPTVQKYVQYGASPRGMQSLILGAKVKAMLESREYVSRNDIESVMFPALRHRIIVNFEGESEGITANFIIDQLKKSVVSN